MNRPTTPPPYPSPDTISTATPFPSDVKVRPAPFDVKTLPTPSEPTLSEPSPSNPFLHSNEQEAQWQTPLQNFEQQIISYQHNAREGGEREQQSAERVAQAMETIADSHTDPKVKAQWRKTAKKFRKAQPKDRENIVVAILKGFLILLTLPFWIVGTTLHAAGEISDGIGLFLKTAGQLTKKLTYRGGKLMKRSSNSQEEV